MFERYNERARRVVFFARYEASQYGSPRIETELLLLGLLREDKGLLLRLKLDKTEAIRSEIDVRIPKRPSFPSSVDIPLSNESKRVLAYAAEEAERLSDRHIGSEHLLLGLMREESCFAAEILSQHGAKLEALRKELAIGPHSDAAKPQLGKARRRPTLPGFHALQHRPPPQNTVDIHGAL